jgi:tRNA-modifying protein YgfZ
VLLQPLHSVRLASLCSPKGRMLASGWVLRLSEDRFAWVIRRDVLDATLKRLKLFQLRMKLVLRDTTADHTLVGLLSREASVSGLQLLEAGGWVAPIGVAANVQISLAARPTTGVPDGSVLPSAEPWLLAEVLTGIAQVQSKTVEAFVPQMLNHESVNGVNFKKGCYPGQEVVARSQFRGAIKRRAALFFQAEGSADVGDPVMQGRGDTSQEVGQVAELARSPGGLWLIASVQTGALASEEPTLSVQGNELTQLALPYRLRDDL